MSIVIAAGLILSSSSFFNCSHLLNIEASCYPCTLVSMKPIAIETVKCNLQYSKKDAGLQMSTINYRFVNGNEVSKTLNYTSRRGYSNRKFTLSG